MTFSTNRICFLDVDGPIIPNLMFVLDADASMQRTQFSTLSLAYVQSLCLNAGAKLVMNSSHNWYLTEKGTDLKDDLIATGLNPDIFHEHWRTDFGSKFSYYSDSMRMRAIENWLEDHKEVDNWVCFDDIFFTDNPNLIVVNELTGITYVHYQLACTHFNCTQHLNYDGQKNPPKTDRKEDWMEWMDDDGDHTHDDRIL